MSVNDPIADFLTRIRNAGMARHEKVEIPHSRMKAEMARILKEQGYINDYSEQSAGAEKRLIIELKYSSDGQRAITGLRRMSRPGRRVYRKQTRRRRRRGPLLRLLGGCGRCRESVEHPLKCRIRWR